MNIALNIAIIAFTERGYQLAHKISDYFEGEGERTWVAKGFGKDKVDHKEWTAENFATKDALVFVGACGIAVRSIAPHVKSKTEDPAVIVIDEGANFCIPLLSGHIGGANNLAVHIADAMGAQPVVTTATDVAGVFAVDSWAVEQGLVVATPRYIKEVSAALLQGQPVTYYSEVPIKGLPPKGVVPFKGSQEQALENADIYIGRNKPSSRLFLIYQKYTLGIGCRKGALLGQIQRGVAAFLAEHHINEYAISKVASIDLKAKEPGLAAFCRIKLKQFETFSADELNQLEGDFAQDDFVQDVTGTSSVCERAAVAAAGPGAQLIIGKTIVEGITCALAEAADGISWPSDEAL